MRLLAPQVLDFADLADGVRRNNVGVAGISLQARASFQDGRLMLQPTGQAFALDGPAPRDGWVLLRVLHWEDPGDTVLQAQAAPAPQGE